MAGVRAEAIRSNDHAAAPDRGSLRRPPESDIASTSRNQIRPHAAQPHASAVSVGIADTGGGCEIVSPPRYSELGELCPASCTSRRPITDDNGSE